MQWVGSIDLQPNESADYSVVVNSAANFETQEQEILADVKGELGDNKLDAVICVAGGWVGGNASKDFAKNLDLMIRQSVWSSAISSTLATAHLTPKGLLVLTGAAPAVGPTPGMLGYGVAKAAVHHLAASLAAPGSGLPEDATVAAILPITLDTPMNRKWMPNGEHDKWTPLQFVAELFQKWTEDKERPTSGSLVKLVTEASETRLDIVGKQQK